MSMTFGPQLTEDEKWESIRGTRNQLLLTSDWTQTLDSPVDKVLWAQYRQELRDITKNFDIPENVSWPLKPGG